MTILKVGYVPEHFSTPLAFAASHGLFKEEGVQELLIPYPSGSGHLIESLKSGEIDIAVGLTEAFVAGRGKGLDWFHIVGTYVTSKLRWAISTGINRTDIKSDGDLIEHNRIGISRPGSGSQVMASVLAVERGWQKGDGDDLLFQWVPLGTFANLRKGVNSSQADAFMWEYFTSKGYYDNKEIKHIGDVYTPWPSWVIVARSGVMEDSGKPSLPVIGFMAAVDKGITYFNLHKDEVIEYISTNLDYSAQDAEAWLKTVEFNTTGVASVDPNVIQKTLDMLIIAHVVKPGTPLSQILP